MILSPCPRCRSDGLLIRPLGIWIDAKTGYGPDGARVVCRNPECHITSPVFNGPTQNEDAVAWWNKTPPRVQELLEANNRNLGLRRAFAGMLRRASTRLREESDWVFRNDLDMTFRADCPDEDLEGLADEIEELLDATHHS